MSHIGKNLSIIVIQFYIFSICVIGSKTFGSESDGTIKVYSEKIDESKGAFPLVSIGVKDEKFRDFMKEVLNESKPSDEAETQNFGTENLRKKSMHLVGSESELASELSKFVIALGQAIFDGAGKLRRNTFLYNGGLALFHDTESSNLNPFPHIDQYHQSLQVADNAGCRGKILTVLIRFNSGDLGKDEVNGTKFFDAPKGRFPYYYFNQEFVNRVKAGKSSVISPSSHEVSITFFDHLFQWHEIEQETDWQKKHCGWTRYGIQLFIFSPIHDDEKNNWEYNDSWHDLDHFDALNALKLKETVDQDKIAKAMKEFMNSQVICKAKSEARNEENSSSYCLETVLKKPKHFFKKRPLIKTLAIGLLGGFASGLGYSYYRNEQKIDTIQCQPKPSQLLFDEEFLFFL